MQRLLYIIIYPIFWLTSLLPMWALYIKSTFLYFITYRIIGYRKKVIKGNLRLVFPEKSDQEINRITSQFYQHLCDLIFETIKLMTMSGKNLRKRYVFKNPDVINELHARNKSVLIMCAHYANWEWSGSLRKDINGITYAVYKKLDNVHFDKLVKKLRERFGAVMITNNNIPAVLFRTAKKRELSTTLILSDQTPKLGAFKQRDTFMGINVPVFTGTEELAKRLDFATVYQKVEKIKRGYYEVTFVPLTEDSKSYKDFEITRLFFDEIEKQIREVPQYYLWSHKRWKHRN